MGELSGIKRKLNNVTKAIAELGHSQALLQRLENLEIRKIRLETKIAETKTRQIPDLPLPDIRLIAKTLRPAIKAASLEEKRVILRGLIHRIDALRDKTDDKIHGVITYYLPADIINKKKPLVRRSRVKILMSIFSVPTGTRTPVLALRGILADN